MEFRITKKFWTWLFITALLYLAIVLGTWKWDITNWGDGRQFFSVVEFIWTGVVYFGHGGSKWKS